MSITNAAVEATRRRFRPIIMTSFAFILGVAPLLIATGAGAASRQSIGTVVFGGMLASTLLAIPFVPVFYVITQRLSGLRRPKRSTDTREEAKRQAGSLEKTREPLYNRREPPDTIVEPCEPRSE
jgi:hypothetical protein